MFDTVVDCDCFCISPEGLILRRAFPPTRILEIIIIDLEMVHNGRSLPLVLSSHIRFFECNTYTHTCTHRYMCQYFQYMTYDSTNQVPIESHADRNRFRCIFYWLALRCFVAALHDIETNALILPWISLHILCLRLDVYVRGIWRNSSASLRQRLFRSLSAIIFIYEEGLTHWCHQPVVS